MIQDEVAEYLLTTNAGLTRRDIHGDRRHGRQVSRRHDVAATVRRVLERLGRDGLRKGIGTVFFAVGVTAALAGLTAVAIYWGALGIAAILAVDRIPDAVFEAPAVKVKVSRSESPGMTVGEYHRRLAIHAEREELKEERIEKRRKRQERKAKARSGGKF